MPSTSSSILTLFWIFNNDRFLFTNVLLLVSLSCLKFLFTTFLSQVSLFSFHFFSSFLLLILLLWNSTVKQRHGGMKGAIGARMTKGSWGMLMVVVIIMGVMMGGVQADPTTFFNFNNFTSNVDFNVTNNGQVCYYIYFYFLQVPFIYFAY